jgi:hypothetical protein
MTTPPPRPSACCPNAAVHCARLHSEDEASDPATLPAAAINALRRRHFQLVLSAEGSGSSAHSSGMATPVGGVSSRALSPSRRSPSRQEAGGAHGHVQHVEPLHPPQLPVPGLGPNRLHAAHHSCGGSPLGPPVEQPHAPAAAVAAASVSARSFFGEGKVSSDCAHCGAAPSSHSPRGGGGGGGGGHFPHHLPIAVLRARLQSLDVDPQTDPFRDRSSPRLVGAGSGRVSPPFGCMAAGGDAPHRAHARRWSGSGVGVSGGDFRPVAAPLTRLAPSPVSPGSRGASGRSSPSVQLPAFGEGGGEGFSPPRLAAGGSSPGVGGCAGGGLGTVAEAPGGAGAEDDGEGAS